MATPEAHLGGGALNLYSPPSQALAVWFDFAPSSITGWTFDGFVSAHAPTPTVPVPEIEVALTITGDDTSSMFANLTEEQVAALVVQRTTWYYQINELSPIDRQLFFGKLVFTNESC